MLELVTAEDARAQIYLDAPDSSGDPNGLWLTIAIQAVSGAVQGWLKDDWRMYLESRDSTGAIVVDSNGDPVPAEDSNGPITHPTVRLAVLVELASQFRFREGEGDNGMGEGYMLSRVATQLLTARRKPTVR
jgi:hypothetical protein